MNAVNMAVSPQNIKMMFCGQLAVQVTELPKKQKQAVPLLNAQLD